MVIILFRAMTLLLVINGHILHEQILPRPKLTGESFENKARAREMIVQASIAKYKQEHPKLFTRRFPYAFYLVGEIELKD